MKRIGFAVLALSSILGCKSGDMRDLKDSLPPGSDEAVVVFTRPSTAAGTASHARIFDGDRLIGLTETGCRIEYRCAPGTHVFYGLGPKSSMAAVRADLAGGKTYCIQTDLMETQEGFLNFKVIMSLIPILKTHQDWKKKTQIYAELSLRELDPQKRQRVEADDKELLAKAQAHFNGPGKDAVITMGKEDGW